MTMMTLDQFQTHVNRTSNPEVDGNFNAALCNWALGLTGESGEFADLVKKAVFHEHPLDEDKAVKELGDILWYVAKAASSLGRPLSVIAQMNVDKLAARYPNGWTREDSIARRDLTVVVDESCVSCGVESCAEWCERDGAECAS